MNDGKFAVRLARYGDLDTIMPIYIYAQKQMCEDGNSEQWEIGYPSRELICNDIKGNNCYVIESLGRICGVFAFIIGDDPTYELIEDGQWLNDRPYGTLHRLASDGSVKGIFRVALDFCESQISEIRIDTHKDNAKMVHLIAKRGYIYCGRIYARNGARLAFQKSIS